MILLPLLSAGAGFGIGKWIKPASSRQVLTILVPMSGLALVAALMLGPSQSSLLLISTAIVIAVFAAGMAGPAFGVGLVKTLAISFVATASVCGLVVLVALLGLGALYQ